MAGTTSAATGLPGNSAFLRNLRELDWLKNNPDFMERPASIVEFVGDDYLNIDKNVRPGLRKALIEIFGEESNPYSLAKVNEAMVTGAIGIGKTTFASIALPYMVHWVLCLKDPQGFFNLMPGSRIAFMQMSTSEDQAKEVIFGDIVARIKNSPWFKKYPNDPGYKNQMRWPDKDIWILPGDSAETTFEGYNILGGILDEMDSHRITPRRDYAEAGYNTISNRITSRFGDRGLFILIGQMKHQSGFAARHYERMKKDSKCHVVRMTLWESFGWEKYLNADGKHDSFWFDVRRKIEIPKLVAETVVNPDFMEVPNLYRKQFISDPERALRDLAGLPPKVGSPFIGMVYMLDAPPELWKRRTGRDESPVGGDLSSPQFAPWFTCHDPLPRAVHIDIAYAADGDALGMAMGHVPELKQVEDEMVPYIVFDFVMRIKPMPGREIVLSDIRQIVYRLKDELHFKIRTVTLDGFQSTDTIQQLQKRRFDAGYQSIDRELLPYENLRSAIYEQRIEWPRHMVQMTHINPDKVDIVFQELSQLIDNGRKIDHPPGGSKDVTDAMAGVVNSLMGDMKYRRGVALRQRSTGENSEERTQQILERMSVEPELPSTHVSPRLQELLQVPGYGSPRISIPDGMRGPGDIYDGTGIQRPRRPS